MSERDPFTAKGGGDRLVVARDGQGRDAFWGKVVGHSDAPHLLVDTGSGVRWWREDMCADADDDALRSAIYHSMKNAEIEDLKRRLEYALLTGGKEMPRAGGV